MVWTFFRLEIFILNDFSTLSIGATAIIDGVASKRIPGYCGIRNTYRKCFVRINRTSLSHECRSAYCMCFHVFQMCSRFLCFSASPGRPKKNWSGSSPGCEGGVRGTSKKIGLVCRGDAGGMPPAPCPVGGPLWALRHRSGYFFTGVYYARVICPFSCIRTRIWVMHSTPSQVHLKTLPAGITQMKFIGK